MSLTTSSVKIHLINNLDNDNVDDSIVIKKNPLDKSYIVTYSDQNNGSPVKHIVTDLHRDNLEDYVYMILKNQSIDEEGYKYIQVTAPAMPRVLVSGSLMKEVYYREHMIEMLGTSLDLLEKVSVK
jgi:hypothetical protein